jgi:hypothetical protein
VPLIIDIIEVNPNFHIFDTFENPMTPALLLFLENPTVKHLSKQNPLEKMMHISPFASSKPTLFEVAKSATPEEYNS